MIFLLVKRGETNVVFVAVQMFLYDAFGSRNLAVSIGQ